MIYSVSTHHLGQKYYELKDHLGNVRATITDLHSMQSTIAQASVESYNNYYAFGMLMPGRTGASENYRYGFNGKEMDNDMSKGVTGAIYDYGFRVVDTRIGRFLSVDPLTKDYPWYTPYQYAGNKPVWATDLDGLEENTQSTYVQLPIPKQLKSDAQKLKSENDKNYILSMTKLLADRSSDTYDMANSIVYSFQGSKNYAFGHDLNFYRFGEKNVLQLADGSFAVRAVQLKPKWYGNVYHPGNKNFFIMKSFKSIGF